MPFDRGYLSPHFVNNPDSVTCEFDNPHVPIHERQISAANTLIPLLAEGIEGVRSWNRLSARSTAARAPRFLTAVLLRAAEPRRGSMGTGGAAPSPVVAARPAGGRTASVPTTGTDGP